MYWFKKLFTAWSVHLETAVEVFVVTIFSLIPLVISALAHNAGKENYQFEITPIIQSSFGGGQLFLYSFSLIGTLIWLSFVRWDIPRIAPRIVIGLIVVVTGFLITSLAGIDPTLSNIKNPFLIDVSYYIYFATILTYYLLLFFCKIEPPSPEESLNKGSNDLMQDYRNMPNE